MFQMQTKNRPEYSTRETERLRRDLPWCLREGSWFWSMIQCVCCCNRSEKYQPKQAVAPINFVHSNPVLLIQSVVQHQKSWKKYVNRYSLIKRRHSPTRSSQRDALLSWSQTNWTSMDHFCWCTFCYPIWSEEKRWPWWGSNKVYSITLILRAN